MTRAARIAHGCWILLAAVSCSLVDPQVGASQALCGLGSAGETQTGSGPGYYHRNATPAGTAPSCEPHPENACNDCESAHCCAARSACYADPVCACADLNLDECLDAADASSMADQATAVSRCWSDFSARGTVEQTRLSCERTWCQSVCNIP